MFNTTNGILTNNTCYNNGNNGIELVGQSKNNLVINNTCFGNDDHGIYISAYCENNTVIENNIGTNDYSGISTFRAYNNRIINNSIIGNYDSHYDKGIYLRESDNNLVKGNLIDHGFTGIELEISDYNNITHNIVHYYQLAIREVGVNHHYCEGNIFENNILIFDDFLPPYINIKEPQENQIFNYTAPSFEVYIVERLATGINSQWYTINDGITNHTFSLINIHTGVDSDGDYISGDRIGVIDQEEWDKQEKGPVILRFYAKDNLGYESYKEVNVTKGVAPPLGSEPIPDYIMITLIVFGLLVGFIAIGFIGRYLFSKKNV